MRRLTMKQHKFVDEYINTGNASESYRRSYDCKNSTNRTIQINASKLLNNTMVALAIKREKERLSRSSRLGSKDIEDNLFSIFERSLETDQLNTARACMMDIAKLNGLIIQKQEQQINTTVNHVSLLEAVKARRTVRNTVPSEQLENDNILLLKDKSA
jgi:phage terminase small subunit